MNTLKDSYSALDARMTEVNNKMEDLENRSKRSNIVLWGLKEGAEAGLTTFESFLKVQCLEKHMQLPGIEVMRAHRTNISLRATAKNPSPVRPIHIYLLRYSDKVQILKAAASVLKNNLFLDSQVFISDDVSKNVREERAELRKFHLKGIRERDDVEFAFIPWSVPAQILFKEKNCSKLKSFKLPDD